MTRKVTSIKGEVVDFDLFEVKRKIGEKPISMDVENRERFVFSKRKRGSKRTVEKMLHEQGENADNVRDALNQQAQASEEVPQKTSTTKSVSKKKTPSKRRIIKKSK